MTYRVSITPAAEKDAEEHFDWIAFEKCEPVAASKWLEGLADLFHDLKVLPSKFPLLPEDLDFPRPLRQAHYHSHRIIFTIDEAEGEVVVLRVFHGARRLKARHLSIAQEE